MWINNRAVESKATEFIDLHNPVNIFKIKPKIINLFKINI